MGWDDDNDMPSGGMVKGCCDGCGVLSGAGHEAQRQSIAERRVFTFTRVLHSSPHFQEVDEYGMPSSKTRRGGMNVMDVGDAGVYR